jgi:hypothetical protein
MQSDEITLSALDYNLWSNGMEHKPTTKANLRLIRVVNKNIPAYVTPFQKYT